jgi:hypothetical protein
MKVALCFIINYHHILNKEEIWKEWIEYNKDIINVYFYYKDFNKIKSPWIIEHTIPPNYIFETSYYHVIPAYLSLMKFAIQHDSNNQWFCMLTDSCCPIISPRKFKYLFYRNFNKSIFSWKEAWWNIHFDKRSNLALLPEKLRLANTPWFVMKRENVLQCLHFVSSQDKLTKTICNGGLANESLFAIIMYFYRQLDKKKHVISYQTHITDWTRMTSSTSPHLFKDVSKTDLNFIETELDKNKYSMFIRKISPEFPNYLLKHYIYEFSKHDDNKLVIREPFIFLYNRYKKWIFYTSMSGLFILCYIFIISISNVNSISSMSQMLS